MSTLRRIAILHKDTTKHQELRKYQKTYNINMCLFYPNKEINKLSRSLLVTVLFNIYFWLLLLIYWKSFRYFIHEFTFIWVEIVDWQTVCTFCVSHGIYKNIFIWSVCILVAAAGSPGILLVISIITVDKISLKT